jgi:hypothetical protein
LGLGTKYYSNTRQKRKLDEMYDQLRSEYESTKRSAIQPAGNFYPRNEPDLFSNPANMMDNRDPIRKGNPFFFFTFNTISVGSVRARLLSLEMNFPYVASFLIIVWNVCFLNVIMRVSLVLLNLSKTS